jgi:hypothetical protein
MHINSLLPFITTTCGPFTWWWMFEMFKVFGYHKWTWLCTDTCVLGEYLGEGWLAHTAGGLATYSSVLLCHLTFSSAVCNSFKCSTSLPTMHMISLLKLRHLIAIWCYHFWDLFCLSLILNPKVILISLFLREALNKW